jgi:hypothetical protein
MANFSATLAVTLATAVAAAQFQGGQNKSMQVNPDGSDNIRRVK